MPMHHNFYRLLLPLSTLFYLLALPFSLLKTFKFLVVHGDPGAEYPSTCLIPITIHPRRNSTHSIWQMTKPQLKEVNITQLVSGKVKIWTFFKKFVWIQELYSFHNTFNMFTCDPSCVWLWRGSSLELILGKHPIPQPWKWCPDFWHCFLGWVSAGPWTGNTWLQVWLFQGRPKNDGLLLRFIPAELIHFCLSSPVASIKIFLYGMLL